MSAFLERTIDLLLGTLKIRRRGGTPGTDEVQISHDGTDAKIAPQSGGVIITPADDGNRFIVQDKDGNNILEIDTSNDRAVVRQPGGTPGTDEVQVSHDGTKGVIDSKDGDLEIVSAANVVIKTSGGNLTFDNNEPWRAKGWAKIDVSGGSPSIADSYNVAAVADNSVGNFTVLWDTDFANTNYCAVGTCVGGASAYILNIISIKTTEIRITTDDGGDGNSNIDNIPFSVVAFGDQ